MLKEYSVSSLDEYQHVVKDIIHGCRISPFIYRGQSNSDWRVESGAFRRISKEKQMTLDTDKLRLSNYIKYHRRLINEAKKHVHSHTVLKDMHDLEILAELQHFDAGTCLIDFTYNPLIALFFACNADNNLDGKVFCYDMLSSRMLSSEDEELPIRFILEKDCCMDSIAWNPTHSNHRIIKQESIFIINPRGYIPREEFNTTIEIMAESKANILTDLKQLFNISWKSIFPDFIGFTKVNSATHILPFNSNHSYLALQAWEDPDLVINYCFQALEVDPDEDDAWCLLALMYLHKTEYSKALKSSRNALAIDSRNERTWMMLGNTHYSMKNFAEAIKSFQEAISIKPDMFEAFFNMGNAYYDIGNFGRAISSYEEVIKGKPDHYYSLASIGWICMRTNSLEKARKYYLKAHEIDKTKGIIVLKLAHISLIEGNFTEALNTYIQSFFLFEIKDRFWFSYEDDYKVIALYAITKEAYADMRKQIEQRVADLQAE